MRNDLQIDGPDLFSFLLTLQLCVGGEPGLLEASHHHGSDPVVGLRDADLVEVCAGSLHLGQLGAGAAEEHESGVGAPALHPAVQHGRHLAAD